jgi:hypothetical protein
MTSVAVHRLESAPPPGAPIGLGTPRAKASRDAAATRAVFRVESLGHLVPRSAFVGSVHSVFVNACNLAVDGALLTVCAATGARGPTTLRLAHHGVDLRDRFAVGEPIASQGGRIRSDRLELDLAHARLWHPAAPRPPLPRAQVESHLRSARLCLQRRRASQRSLLDGDGAPAAAALAAACRDVDLERATRHAARLVGWGEGLTPAGDDFLVGLLAGLAALVRDEASRREFHAALARAIAARASSTTPIAAHLLRLAAAGHWAEPLVSLRDALLCADDDAVHAAMQGALAVGATSGADTASGLVAGITVWLPSFAREAA